MIGLDTTAIIDLFKEDIQLKKLLDSIEGSFSTTILNYQEILFGLNPKDRYYMMEKEYYNSFFDSIFLLDLDKESVKSSSEIYWNLMKKGQPIGKFDCMVAGIFFRNKITKIITRNVKHFEKIKGIKVLKY